MNNVMTLTGKVKFFNQDKGYGFITGDDNNEYFVHVTKCTDTIKKNDNVSFCIEEGKKGPAAVDVQLN